jgi:hypothetical protein
MGDLVRLIEALPECGTKAALRGIRAAADSTHDEQVIAESLVRMARIVREWRAGDPLTRLDTELRQLTGG